MCDDGGVLVETRSHASGDPGLEGERDPMRADVVGATDDIGPIPRRNDFGTYVSEVTFDKLYVHIDFKGSPPRPQYIMDCFPLFKDAHSAMFHASREKFCITSSTLLR